ncbi:MAG: glycosyltransferase family 9 protein [Endomicrobia bacterium]|nr:glycosyltransferase family 9 protein [Endomicrobiia bacterium]
MTTPAIKLLKTYVNNCKIYVVVKSTLVELIEDNPYIDGIIIKKNRLDLIKNLMEHKPDFIMLFRTTFFNSIATFLSGPKFSVGIEEEFSKFFLRSTIKKSESRSFRIECIMLVEKLFNHLNVKTDNNLYLEAKKLHFYGYKDKYIDEEVTRKFNELNIKEKKFIVLITCASRETKMLTLSHYVTLISKLSKFLNNEYKILLSGSAKDRNFIEHILKFSDKNRIKHIPTENLKLLANIYSKAFLIIGPDTGPSYISEAVFSKTIIFFTSTSPEKYGPFGDNIYFVYYPVGCSPCYKDKCKINKVCIDRFPLYELIDKIIRIIENEKDSN